MEIYKSGTNMNRLLIIATIGLIFSTSFLIENVSASPKIRSDRKGSGGSTLGSQGSDTNEINHRSADFVPCYETIPCGWALYNTERRQPFRRISTYTRNRL